MASAEGRQLTTLFQHLLTGRRQRGTLKFKNLKHNDELVPLVERLVRLVLDRVAIQNAWSCDVQGPRDEGGDVAVRIVPDESRSAEYICFQVKAHDELGRSGIASKLREQHSRAVDMYDRLLQYFILPFGVADPKGKDESGKWVGYSFDRRDVVRRISVEFVRKNEVTVVTPRELAAFVELTNGRVDAYIKSIVGEEDVVVEKAAREIEGLLLHQIAPLMRLAAHAAVRPCEYAEMGLVESDPLVESTLEGLPRRYEAGAVLPQYEPGGHSEMAPRSLRRELFEMSDLVELRNSHVRLVPDALPAVRALLQDALVRFDHGIGDLVDYAAMILRLDAPAEEELI